MDCLAVGLEAPILPLSLHDVHPRAHCALDRTVEHILDTAVEATCVEVYPAREKREMTLVGGHC